MSTKFNQSILLVLLGSVFLCSSAYAELSSKEIQRKLTILRGKIHSIEKEVDSSSLQLESKAKILSDIELEVSKLDKGQRDGELRLKKISKELESISLQLVDGNAQLQVKRANFLTRLRGMYKSRRGLPALSFIFSSENVHSLYRRTSYMQKLIVEDHSQLSEYESLLKTLSETELARQSYFKEEAQVVERIKTLKSDQVKKKLEAAHAARELKEQIENRKLLVASMHKEEEEFESLLSRIMGGDSHNPKVSLTPESVDKPTIVDNIITKKSVFYPVPGTVVQHFGKQKHSDYKEVVNVKGIEMSAASGSLVRAIADGSVVFSSTLPGFGNVVIVEHPGKFYSLYGRINEPAPIGKALGKGDSVGVTSEKDEKGRNFYFELRKNGVPLNPEDYLKRG